MSGPQLTEVTDSGCSTFLPANLEVDIEGGGAAAGATSTRNPPTLVPSAMSGVLPGGDFCCSLFCLRDLLTRKFLGVFTPSSRWVRTYNRD